MSRMNKKKSAQNAAKRGKLNWAAKHPVLAKTDAFMAKHSPSQSDLRWYKGLGFFTIIAYGLFKLTGVL